jgi:hypothetical protein
VNIVWPKPKQIDDFKQLDNSESQGAAAFARVRASDESSGLSIDDNCVSAAEALRSSSGDPVPTVRQLVSDDLREFRLHGHFLSVDMIEARRRDRFLNRLAAARGRL